MRRAAAALLVLLAGCGGPAGVPDAGGASTPTVTPAPVPTGTAGEGGETPPGLTERRLVDADALVNAHARVLANASHTIRERVVERYPNGTVRSRYESVRRRDGVRASYRLDQTRRAHAPGSYRIEQWTDGQSRYTAKTSDNDTTYEAGPPPAGPAVGPAVGGEVWSLRRLLAYLTVRGEGTVERGGRTYYRLGTPRPQAAVPPTNVTLVALVSPAGLVAEYRVSYDIERQRGPTRVEVVVTVDEVGSTTVTRPDWYGRARNATG